MEPGAGCTQETQGRAESGTKEISLTLRNEVCMCEADEYPRENDGLTEATQRLSTRYKTTRLVSVI